MERLEEMQESVDFRREDFSEEVGGLVLQRGVFEYDGGVDEGVDGWSAELLELVG